MNEHLGHRHNLMMAEQCDILVVGVGAVGTMVAFVLQKSGLATVTVILRSNYDVVNAEGFHIKSIDHGEVDGWKPHHSKCNCWLSSLRTRLTFIWSVERTMADAVQHGPFDYVVVALKNLPDVYSIPEIIRPVVTSTRTSIVLVQNGIDIEQPLISAFPQNTVISGVALIGSEQTGREVLHNDPDILIIGCFPDDGSRNKEQKSCERMASMYDLGGAKCNVVDDINWYRWRKLVWNASFNSICALTGLDSGAIQDAGGLETLIRPTMGEVVDIAKAAGYSLPPDIQDQMVAFTPKETRLRPSMQMDAIRQQPMEIEAILGNTLRIAQKLGVGAPNLTMIYDLLKAKQWRFINKE